MQSQGPPISAHSFQTSHSRWQALTNRTPSAHSAFLYGVKSTKIYCRPTCSARLARRANIVFYDSEDQARIDGFRPCKRCKPDNTAFVGDGEEIVTRVIALLRVKRSDATMKGGLKELANEVGVTPSYLCRVFKKTMGLTIGTYMKEFETEDTTCNPFQSPSTIASSLPGIGTEDLTPLTARWSSSSPVDEHIEAFPMQNSGDVVLSPDLNFDLDFDFDQWFWTEDFSNYDIYK